MTEDFTFRSPCPWLCCVVPNASPKTVVSKLHQALVNSVYPDREPTEVRNLANAVGKLFERDRFATKKEVRFRHAQPRCVQRLPCAMAVKGAPRVVKKSSSHPPDLGGACLHLCVQLEEMRKLAADASHHFPSEFFSAIKRPEAVRASFKRAEAAAASLAM